MGRLAVPLNERALSTMKRPRNIINYLVVFLLWVLSSIAAFEPTRQRGLPWQVLHGAMAWQRVDEPAGILGDAAFGKITDLVQARSKERSKGNYEDADRIRRAILEISIPEGYEISIEDIPRKQGGGSKWTLLSKPTAFEDYLPGSTILQLAHISLGLAVETSNRASIIRSTAWSREEADRLCSEAEDYKAKMLDQIMHEVLERLKHPSVQHEMGGRKAADAAFWFALAGMQDKNLYNGLVRLCTLELERFGDRASCRTKDIYQILERLASAGVEYDAGLERAARQSLISKGDASVGPNNVMMDLHSDRRSLLLIWKFSTKQKKQKAFLQSALRHWERQRDSQSSSHENAMHNSSSSLIRWSDAFDDPTRPLIVDIGCGMGISMLGLSTCTDTLSTRHLLGERNEAEFYQWKDCNFVGVDLAGLGIDYAKGVAKRWGIHGRTHFVIGEAEGFVERIRDEYPGPVQLCLIQFPTPYKLEKDGTGNSQLPTSPQDGFMVTPRLLSLVSSILTTSGKLLIQSNVEDVALWIRSAAHEKGGFSTIDSSAMEQDYEIFPTSSPRIPQRTLDWIAMGGARADGPGWYMKPLLPRKGATETEVACILNGTPVHRCLLSKSTKN